ncbi:MAG: amidohydrolase [Acidobacteriota bacterium]|nr:amidohydrolase [Acidobacteriota bacterium]
MRHGFSIFDTHTHLGHARHSGRVAMASDLLRVMDAHGIERAVAIPFPVVDDHRAEHNLIGAAIREHAGRFVGAACLSPFLPRAEFRDEVRRCREVFGFRALKLQPQYHGLNPMLESSAFFFETALENEMTVIVHTGAGAPFSAPSLCMMPARQFPDVTIVVAHCGGGIYVHDAIVAAAFCPNIVLELSSLMPHHVREVLAHIPADRLMIGSDLPENTETEIGKILSLDIPASEKRLILSGTANRHFGDSE